MKFYFADGIKLCVYDDGKVTAYDSQYIENYKNNLQSIARSHSWKHSGQGAIFRGDTMPDSAMNGGFACSIEGVYPTANGLCYSACCDDSCGVYRKTEIVNNNTNQDKKEYASTQNPAQGLFEPSYSAQANKEEHIVNSNEKRFIGGIANGDYLVCSAYHDPFVSDIAMFDLKTDNYRTLTEGDTQDADPFYTPQTGDIYFVSRGVGRDAKGHFVRYSPAEILRLHLADMVIDPLYTSSVGNLKKPIPYNGKLFAVELSDKKKGANPLLEIVLIPYRILQSIVNFINLFVSAFTGKSLTSGGANPAKGRDTDGRQLFIKGNLVKVDEELKRNARRKDGEGGFIPYTWTLKNLTDNKVIAHGVADYDIDENGTIIYTNGKHIYAIENGVKRKLCQTDSCLTLSFYHNDLVKNDAIDTVFKDDGFFD